MRFLDLEKRNNTLGEDIVCIGVGIQGSNIINKMRVHEKYMKSIVINTFESLEEIEDALNSAYIVFIVADSSMKIVIEVSTIIAQIAKERASLVISIVSISGGYIGRLVHEPIGYSLDKLKKESNSVITIYTGIRESTDRRYTYPIIGILGVLFSNGVNDFNLNFTDVHRIMKHKGKALVSRHEYKGVNAAAKAVSNAITSLPINNVHLHKAKGFLVHFSACRDFLKTELTNAIDILHQKMDKNAEIIFGTSKDENINENTISVIIIATGFEKE